MGCFATLPDDLGSLRSPKTPKHAQVIDSLQETGFSRTVAPVKDVKPGSWLPAHIGQIAPVAQVQAMDTQREWIGSIQLAPTSDAHWHHDTDEIDRITG